MDKLILSELTNGLNTVWMLLAAMLVFFMQPGFALVEAGFTRVKIYDNESMAMIPAKKILKNGHIVQRYKRFGGYEIIESKLRAELPKGVKPADRKEENK